MKILKFGGTSVGSAERIRSVAKLVCDGQKKIVVLSAMSQTTNTLVEISHYLLQKNTISANEVINKLEQRYATVISELYTTTEYKTKATDTLHHNFRVLRNFTKNDFFTTFEEKHILAQGELMSTCLFQLFLEEQGTKSVLLPALDYMRIDKNNEPNTTKTRDLLEKTLGKQEDNIEIFVTQGFICRNSYGEIDNLQRGGSDYSASLIGAAIQASEIQIWTDIDGMHNNDPRFVENTQPVANLHFEEAAELAYFGAKILHPTCILPAKIANIPVRLLNTLNPAAAGTMISNKLTRSKIKAVAAKDNITAIKIKSGRMLLAHGFLRKVFEIFESRRTSIDIITTSEVGMSVTIDNCKFLEEIVSELKKFGTVTIEKEMSIICVVGDMDSKNVGFQSKALEALKNIPIRMVSYGGSNFNVSFVVKEANKQEALQSLSKHLFN